MGGDFVGLLGKGWPLVGRLRGDALPSPLDDGLLLTAGRSLLRRSARALMPPAWTVWGRPSTPRSIEPRRDGALPGTSVIRRASAAAPPGVGPLAGVAPLAGGSSLWGSSPRA